MKNDEQMYQSVLSRRDAYRAEKARRRGICLRAVPVLACGGLAAALGLGYWNHLRKLPPVPVTPAGSEAAVTTVTDVSAYADSQTETVTTAAHTAQMQVTPASSTQTAAEPRETETAAVSQTETQVPADALPVPQTQPMTQTVPVSEQTAVTTEEPAAADPPAVTTTDPYKPSQNPGNPVDIQAQPLIYPDIQAAAEAVRNGDTSAFELREKYAYRAMFNQMMHDGFLYQVSSANGVTLQDDRGITLYPAAEYEDIGVGCRGLYQGQSYYVAFCYADYKYLTMPEYLQMRMKRTSDKDITVNGGTVCLRFADDGQITANAFIEQNDYSEVYYTVRAAVSETEMLDFLNAMQYEIIPLR
ncbi:MAG: hypothetical protein J5722_00320 [Oscillospiraceae bacterium]|nr:hypothetical protein [Oscillospiraceae bacterium]